MSTELKTSPNLLDRGALWASRLLGLGAAILLFAMMVLTFVDVWGRYVFNSPVRGGFEVTELMMAALIFAGLPLVTAAQEHVSVDLLDYAMPKAVRRIRDLVINIACSGMLAVLSHRLWLRALEQLGYGDETAALSIPIAPVTFFMSVSSALSAIVLLYIGVERAVRRSR